MSFPDRQVRLFKFLRGKMFREYDESLQAVSEMQQAGTTIHHLDDMEFGRRLAVEKELEKSNQARFVNAVFDNSGNFIIYGSLLGVKIVNIRTNKVVCLLGKSESNRFVNVSLYQGAPKKKAVYTLVKKKKKRMIKESMQMIKPLY